MPDQTTAQQPAGVHPDELSPGDADPTIATLEDIYLDGTLVLVGCGAKKRDPEDPVDLHQAAVAPGKEIRGPSGPTGPAWEARDLYTSTYFQLKREFAEVVSTWGGEWGWSVLSAEHHVLAPWSPVRPYDTTIDDLGDDPTNEDHWYTGALTGNGRRPDGQECVTERDVWARRVAIGLNRWITSHLDGPRQPGLDGARTLVVLAGQDYIEPLRERGVFEYGTARMTGDPNDVRFKLPATPRFLFEEIDAGGIGEQMAWLSDAVDRMEVSGEPRTEETEVTDFT